jgi:hypothetical protein
MELSKGHILVMFVILEAYYPNFMSELEEVMECNQLNELQKKKILLNVKLLNVQRTKWTTNDDWIICYFVSYFVWRLIKMRDNLDFCFKNLDKKAKKESLTGIIDKDTYLLYRRVNFQITKLCDLLPKYGDVDVIIENEKIIFSQCCQ